MATEWLQDLEERVKEASDRLRDLRKENEKLTKRIAKLEGQVAAAPDADEVASWTAERDDIRQRVEKLVDHLGDMLKD